MRRLALLLVLLAAPAAFAQLETLTPDKLAGGTVGYVLAVVVFVEAVVIAYLFKIYLDETRGRREDAARHSAETLETLTGVVTVNLKMGEGLEVLDRAVDTILQEKR